MLVTFAATAGLAIHRRFQEMKDTAGQLSVKRLQSRISGHNQPDQLPASFHQGQRDAYNVAFDNVCCGLERPASKHG